MSKRLLVDALEISSLLCRITTWEDVQGNYIYKSNCFAILAYPEHNLNRERVCDTASWSCPKAAATGFGDPGPMFTSFAQRRQAKNEESVEQSASFFQRAPDDQPHFSFSSMSVRILEPRQGALFRTKVTKV